MANERITEDLVEGRLRELGYYDDPDEIVVEKQQSVVQEIRKGLSRASKTGKGKAAGYPEFIITAPGTPDMVVLIECKADVKQLDAKDPVKAFDDSDLIIQRVMVDARDCVSEVDRMVPAG